MDQDTIELQIDPDCLADYCDKPEIHAASYRVRSLWRRGTDDLNRITTPRYTYRRFQLQSTEGAAVGAAPLVNAQLRMALEPCHSAVLFILTLGHEIDRLLERLKSRDPVYAVTLDDIASTLAEELAKRIHRSFATDLTDDEALTERFSPGYCAWPLAQQEAFFSLFDEDTAGVHLDASFLMHPRKSVSAIFGIGERSAVERWGNPCRFCGRSCPHRRAPQRHPSLR